MSAIVSYIKADGTKGSISFSEVNEITEAISRANDQLFDDVIDDEDVRAAVKPGQSLFTITKAELVDNVQNYSGHVSSL